MKNNRQPILQTYNINTLTNFDAYLMNILRSDSLYLRALEPEDVDYLLRWENDPDVWVVSDTIAPFSRHCIEQYVLNYDADVWRAGQLRMMIQTDSRALPVGIVDLYNLDRAHQRGFIGIFIEPDMRRHRYALEALNLLSRYAYAILGLRQVAAIVEVDNYASCALFEAAGFERCGLMRAWRKRGSTFHDVYIYQKLRGS